ncbi:MAG: type II secretion system protein [Planctomycetes bacterium]|nr:type II secretion system protein [Planctomycetota bacterium]MCH8118745.1 type II secretion system protein [Planctomycetota bacterium]
MNERRGFMLIELFVVIVITELLMSILMTALERARHRVCPSEHLWWALLHPTRRVFLHLRYPLEGTSPRGAIGTPSFSSQTT